MLLFSVFWLHPFATIFCVEFRGSSYCSVRLVNWSTSAVLVADVWEPPDVAEVDSESYDGEEKVEFASPRLALHRFVAIARRYLAVLLRQPHLQPCTQKRVSGMFILFSSTFRNCSEVIFVDIFNYKIEPSGHLSTWDHLFCSTSQELASQILHGQQWQKIGPWASRWFEHFVAHSGPSFGLLSCTNKKIDSPTPKTNENFKNSFWSVKSTNNPFTPATVKKYGEKICNASGHWQNFTSFWAKPQNPLWNYHTFTVPCLVYLVWIPNDYLHTYFVILIQIKPSNIPNKCKSSYFKTHSFNLFQSLILSPHLILSQQKPNSSNENNTHFTWTLGPSTKRIIDVHPWPNVDFLSRYSTE